MKIDLIDKIQGTRVMAKALIVNASMIEQGIAGGEYHPFSIESKAIVATTDDRIVGLIIWKQQDEPDVWISLAWVDPEFRRKGLYQMMFERLRAECVKLNIREIEGFIYENNNAMKRAAEKAGRTATRTVYTLKLLTAEECLDAIREKK